jgi:DNA polymerase I
LHLVQSIDDLDAMKRWAGQRRETPLMFDTETGGLNPHKDAVRLIQLGDMHEGWSVPFQMWGGGAMELLQKYEGRLGAHNRPFDIRFLERHAGWAAPWHKIDDTLTMAHLVDPSRPRGLKPLADRLVDRRASAGQEALHDGMRKQGWTWATVPETFKPYWIYAALDPVLTAHVWGKLHKQVEDKYATVYSFEQEAGRCCSNMAYTGIKVDVPYLLGKIRALKEFSQNARDWMLKTWDVSSPMSGPQLARALEKSGQEIMFWTEAGSAQMDKESLAWYKVNARSPEVAQLIEYVLAVRHAEKMTGTYLETLLELRDADSLVHCSIWPLGARTGRMSITDPALQTLPRDDLVVRGAFIPHEGHVFISCDYDQVEGRLAAHFSEDPGLIAAFLAADAPGGKDFFSAIATTLFREDVEKKDKRRQAVKNMTYARLFGAGLEKMALTAGVTAEWLRPVRDEFDAHYPGLRLMDRKIMDDARLNAAAYGSTGVLTPLGRFLPAERGKEYALVNYLIQGTAAEILKQAIINCEAMGLGPWMRLPVHDELLFEVPAEQAEKACRTIQIAMENRKDYRVPLTCKPQVMAERWAGKE